MIPIESSTYAAVLARVRQLEAEAERLRARLADVRARLAGVLLAVEPAIKAGGEG